MADRLARPVVQFLYGADLHPERLAACCPHAEVVAIGELGGFRLAFFGHDELWDGGFETVVADEHAAVFGLVVALTGREADLLDKVRGVRLNGTGTHFHFPVAVGTPGGAVEAVLYKLDDGRQPSEPSAECLAYMVAGARHFGLPSAYVAELGAQASHPATFPVPRIAFPTIVSQAGGGCDC